MYEPIRTKSVHSTPDHPADFPHRSREEELDTQLAAHLAALLAVTDELRLLTGDPALEPVGERLAQEVTRLRGDATVIRHAGTPPRVRADEARVSALHARAHALAGRALVVAASRADTAAAILAAERMDAHAARATAGAVGD